MQLMATHGPFNQIEDGISPGPLHLPHSFSAILLDLETGLQTASELLSVLIL